MCKNMFATRYHPALCEHMNKRVLPLYAITPRGHSRLNNTRGTAFASALLYSYKHMSSDMLPLC